MELEFKQTFKKIVYPCACQVLQEDQLLAFDIMQE